MARLIKKAEVIVKKLSDEYKIGEKASWKKLFHDGRLYENYEYVGETELKLVIDH